MEGVLWRVVQWISRRAAIVWVEDNKQSHETINNVKVKEAQQNETKEVTGSEV